MITSRSSRALLLVLLSSISVGCSAGPSRLTFRSQADGRAYAETFPEVYVTEAQGGPYDVVLVNAPTPVGAQAGADSRPITDISQVLHIRVFWRPLRGSKTDISSATNAAITWYVRRPGRERDGMLVYQGAGFVVVSPDNGGAHFSVRDASVAVKDKRGDIDDPLGRCTLSGEFFARRDAEKVREILTELKNTYGAAPASTQPTRAVGP